MFSIYTLKLSKCKLDRILGTKQYFQSYTFSLMFFWSYGHFYLFIRSSGFLFIWSSGFGVVLSCTLLLVFSRLKTFTAHSLLLPFCASFIPKLANTVNIDLPNLWVFSEGVLHQLASNFYEIHFRFYASNILTNFKISNFKNIF